MQKSYTEVKKRRKALQQKKSFEESWHELQKMIASMSQHHQHHPTLSSHQPSFSGSLHGMLPTISALHGGPPRTFTHFSMTEEAADDHLYLYGNRNMSTDSTTTTAMNLTRINEFQFVIFILRHLQIIDDKKHIQPWIKVSEHIFGLLGLFLV